MICPNAGKWISGAVVACLLTMILSAAQEGHIESPAAKGEKDPFPAMRAPFFSLVAEGKATAAIISPATPSPVEKYAAEELGAYVARMTDTALPVSNEAVPGSYPIYIGASARRRLAEFNWAALGDEGFLLRCGPEGAYVAGQKALGTLYGVYTLLERFGVRWLMPGDIGQVVPSRSDLQIGTLDETQTPSFTYRWVENGDWALRNKMNAAVTVNKEPVGPQWKWSYHTHFLLVPPEVYFEKHPEWFALVNGRRRRPADKHTQSHQLCTSNPELIEQMAANVIRFFHENPEIDILSLSPQDGGGFCQCDACRALDEERSEDEAWHARYSNRLAVFNNEVARRVAQSYPDKLIKVGAYAMYCRVPLGTDYRPEPNLAIQICHTYSCNNHPVDSPCPRQRKYFAKELEHWAAIANHLFLYEYYRKGMWGDVPYDQVHVIRFDIPYYRKIGVEGFYTQAAGNHWPACGLNHYVAAKLTWDVDLDVDRLLSDYYEKAFAEAAAPMRNYYEGLMAAYVDYGDCISPYGYKWPTFALPAIFTADVVGRLEEALAEAEDRISSDTVRKRITPIRARLEYMKRVLHYLAAVRAPFDGIDLGDEQALKRAHQEAMRIGTPLSKEIQSFCRGNGVHSFNRIDAAHENLRFLVELPDQEPLLR